MCALEGISGVMARANRPEGANQPAPHHQGWGEGVVSGTPMACVRLYRLSQLRRFIDGGVIIVSEIPD